MRTPLGRQRRCAHLVDGLGVEWPREDRLAVGSDGWRAAVIRRERLIKEIEAQRERHEWHDDLRPLELVPGAAHRGARQRPRNSRNLYR